MVLECYRGDRHEALLRSSVYPSGNLVQSLVEVLDRESLSKSSTPFVPLSVAITASVLVVVGLIGRCVGGHLLTVDFGTPSSKFTINICTYLII
jgi:hypothetical protein